MSWVNPVDYARYKILAHFPGGDGVLSAPVWKSFLGDESADRHTVEYASR